MEHEAGMPSFKTEDLLQQLDIQHMQNKLQQAQQEQKLLQRSLKDPLSFFHWIGISTMVTFVAVTLLARCVFRMIRQRDSRPTRSPTLSKPAIPMLELPAPAAPHAPVNKLLDLMQSSLFQLRGDGNP
jgi:hypothetical protein